MVEHIPKVICGSPDKPLKIGNLEIPCYVLEDETRVLHQRGMVNALGMARGSSGGSGGDRLAKFVIGKSLNPYISNKLIEVTQNPLKFRTSKGSIAYGYEATVLVDICEAVLEARKENALQKQQLHIAVQCEIVVRSLAKVGIIALVDEVTGYQDLRVKNALANILEKFIAEEYREWTKTFPDAFYREIFRLKGWPWDPKSVKRPSVIGHYTNDIVYDRLAPGILKGLREKDPQTEKGYRPQKLHQWLTGDVGDPSLRAHLEGTMALMRVSPNWRRFNELLNRAYTKYGDNIALALEFKEDYED
jgi:hypothetical protein